MVTKGQESVLAVDLSCVSKISGNTLADSVLQDRIWDGVNQGSGCCRLSGVEYHFPWKWSLVIQRIGHFSQGR